MLHEVIFQKKHCVGKLRVIAFQGFFPFEKRPHGAEVMNRSCQQSFSNISGWIHIWVNELKPSAVLRWVLYSIQYSLQYYRVLTRRGHNFCSMRSFFKRKNALESWEWELSNAFFRLKKDPMEQKLWVVLVNRLLGVKIHPPQNSSKNACTKVRPVYYVLGRFRVRWIPFRCSRLLSRPSIMLQILDPRSVRSVTLGVPQHFPS